MMKIPLPVNGLVTGKVIHLADNPVLLIK